MKHFSAPVFGALFLGALFTAQISLPQMAHSANWQVGNVQTQHQRCIDGDASGKSKQAICSNALLTEGLSARQISDLTNELGQAFLDQDRNEAAKEQFLAALDIDPSNPKAMLSLGWIGYGNSTYPEAENWFRRSLEHQLSAEAFAGLGGTLFRSDSSRSDEALMNLEIALAMSPNYRWAMRELGWLLIETEKFAASLDMFEKALQLWSDDDHARSGKAWALYLLDRDQEALEQINLALELAPDDFYYLRNRARILRALQRHTQVVRDSDRLIELQPERAAGYLLKARSLKSLRRIDQALAVLEQGSKAVKNAHSLMYYRAEYLFEDNQLAKAQEVNQAILDTGDADADDYAQAAAIWNQLKKTNKTRVAVDNALRLEPEHLGAIYYDALLLIKEIGPDAAIARFDEYVRLYPETEWIGDFAGQLFDAGYGFHAIALRARY